MSTSHIVVLPGPEALDSLGERIRRLQTEARMLAHEHLEQLSATLDELTRITSEIAQGGELYPVGVRELARRLADESAKHAFTLAALVDRA